jgi:endonuclease/exonuclease/phosphatase family metal-dependent hydrolase
MPILTIISINTWKGEDAYDIRMEYLRKQLLSLNPDIILMQECFEAPSIEKDTISYINQAFNYHLDYIQAREKFRSFEGFPVHSFSNMAVLSKLPILNSYHYPLPMSDGDDMRFGQEIEFFLENGKTAILTNVHLTHLNQKELVRMEQIKKITERVKLNTTKLNIIGGDFNTTFYSSEIQYFIKELNAIETFSHLNPNTKHSTLVEGQLKGVDIGVDFIFLNNTLRQFKLQQAKTCINEPIPTQYGFASDHFGMLLKIEYA